MKAAQKILVNNGIRPTVNRVAVLAIFMKKTQSFSQARLMGLLNNQINRVSLYRVLSDLVSGGILCRLISSNGTAQYHYLKKAIHKLPLRPHFKCNTCEKIVDLPALPVSYVSQILNLGHIENSGLLIEGICLACTK